MPCIFSEAQDVYSTPTDLALSCPLSGADDTGGIRDHTNWTLQGAKVGWRSYCASFLHIMQGPGKVV